MEIKKISTEKLLDLNKHPRPNNFEDFIGQEHIKGVLKTAIQSAKKRESHMGHILFSGPSGFGKTTIAHIISKQGNIGIKAVTGYAISKPAEIVSILNSLESGDILFIDEIHRLKPNIEEVLYIAMEDFVIDMVMPEGGNVRIPINPFTLIGATTKSESLSQPIKNRFIYNFHFMDYSLDEKKILIKKYLTEYKVKFEDKILNQISSKVDSVPREIHNMCIKIRDFIVAKMSSFGKGGAGKAEDLILDENLRNQFILHSKIDDGGLTPLHNKYLEILKKADRPMGVKAIAVQLGINEKAVEEDVEPLLLKLGKIEKTAGGRVFI
ncbi:AAA family ATPase [Candidatus Gracilibacteria bacterium]|nr:AAA family ATPase [Candidatus Gracilibacteria bacterium]